MGLQKIKTEKTFLFSLLNNNGGTWNYLVRFAPTFNIAATYLSVLECLIPYLHPL